MFVARYSCVAHSRDMHRTAIPVELSCMPEKQRISFSSCLLVLLTFQYCASHLLQAGHYTCHHAELKCVESYMQRTTGARSDRLVPGPQSPFGNMQRQYAETSGLHGGSIGNATVLQACSLSCPSSTYVSMSCCKRIRLKSIGMCPYDACFH